MNTLHAHLEEMLNAIDKQMQIPWTKLHGGVWIANRGLCIMCAAGAWYAQKYGRGNLTHFDVLDNPVKDTLYVMDLLRQFNILEAHKLLYGRGMRQEMPYCVFRGNAQTMDADWRALMEKLLLWLKENNL